MMNGDDDQKAAATLTPGGATAPGDAPPRSARQTRGGTLTPFAPQDEVNPEEWARLLDVYDSSFRNIAEGEVMKGTVLKVTDSEVIVDVGLQVGRHHRHR